MRTIALLAAAAQIAPADLEAPPGVGLHFNPTGKVALVAMESPEYQRLAADSTLEQTRAMRSKRG